MGAFFAESLILAETGNSIGAIQVAGTAMPAQLPFFVAACDYTLIGEEFFAASAYLSGSRTNSASLKGQDVGKIIVAAGVLIGVVLATLAGAMQQSSPDSGMTGFLLDAVEFFKDTMLK
jgi:ribose/xylose/arabinose/galactoside ABC-type transport system permease subunit